MKNNVFESPVTTWNFKKTSLDKRYIGPMAQDFYREFPLWGKDSLAINSVIFDGVNFAGIKALIGRTDSLKSQIKAQAETSVTKKDFDSFRDSIKCFTDACERIKKLENIIVNLQDRLDSLENKGGITEKKKDNPQLLSASYEDIILEQNNPNPFSETSTINYYLPIKYSGAAKVILTDESGINKIQDISISIGKPGQITISAKEMNTGIYIYSIQLNSSIIKSKKMMVIK